MSYICKSMYKVSNKSIHNYLSKCDAKYNKLQNHPLQHGIVDQYNDIYWIDI